jgi:hypothetical protein
MGFFSAGRFIPGNFPNGADQTPQVRKRPIFGNKRYLTAA